MKILTSILSIMCLTSIFAVAQEVTAPEQRSIRQGPVPYMERVERGFGQLREPRWAGDRPDWMAQRGNMNHPQRIQIIIINQCPQGPMTFNRGMERGPRGPMMGQGRGFRGGREMTPRNHDNNRDERPRRGRPQGR